MKGDSVQNLLETELYRILSRYPDFFSISEERNVICGYVKHSKIGYLECYFNGEFHKKEKLITLGFEKLKEKNVKEIIMFTSSSDTISILEKLGFKCIRYLKLYQLKIPSNYVTELEDITCEEVEIKIIDKKDILLLKEFYDKTLPYDLRHSLAELKAWYENNKSGFYGAYLNNRLVGGVFGHRGLNGIGWIRGLIVSLDYRHRNIGSRLLSALIRYFINLGVTEVSAVIPFNYGSVSNFYEKNGFIKKGIIKEFKIDLSNYNWKGGE